MMTARYGRISELNPTEHIGWYPGQLVGQAAAKSMVPTIPDWVKYGGAALAAVLVLAVAYNLTR